MTAKEAVACGFATAILPNLSKGDIINYKEIPGVEKLLATDYQTLINCKKLMNEARNTKHMEEHLDRESEGLVSSWLVPGFQNNLKSYMKSLRNTKPKA